MITNSSVQTTNNPFFGAAKYQYKYVEAATSDIQLAKKFDAINRAKKHYNELYKAINPDSTPSDRLKLTKINCRKDPEYGKTLWVYFKKLDKKNVIENYFAYIFDVNNGKLKDTVKLRMD